MVEGSTMSASFVETIDHGTYLVRIYSQFGVLVCVNHSSAGAKGIGTHELTS